MKKTSKIDCWSDQRSYIFEKYDDVGKLHIHGTVFFHNAEFQFTLVQQATGNVIMRGRVSVYSPKTGRIMQYSGKKKSEILKKHNYTLDNDKRIPELNMTTTVTSNSLDIDRIKDSISRSVNRLYLNNATRINQEIYEISRPDTVTPIAAAYRHVDYYLRKNYKTVSLRVYNKYRNDILNTYLMLPHIPMADYKIETIESFLKAANLSQHRQKLFRSFWEYCCQTGIYSGNLPFPKKQKRKTSPETSARKAKCPDVLSLKLQDRIFKLIIDNPIGGDLGFSLMLWGGYSAKDACSFCWKDVIFEENHDDYIRIKYFKPDLAGATHDYTAPIFPCGALVLRKRYEYLRKTFTEEELSNMPIVSLKSNPQRAMAPEALIQYIALRLHSLNFSYESLYQPQSANKQKASISRLLLYNTYVNNVYYQCGLEHEEGTARFLCRLSLHSNTTDDHYTCMSDEEAGHRLHNYMSILRPEVEISPLEEGPKELPNGTCEYTYVPETTRRCVGIVNNYKLNPGEQLVVFSRHGITGSIWTRGYNEDGSLRRKSKEKCKHDSK